METLMFVYIRYFSGWTRTMFVKDSGSGREPSQRTRLEGEEIREPTVVDGLMFSENSSEGLTLERR